MKDTGKMKRILSTAVTVVLLIIFSSCAGFDFWLKPDISSVISSEPVAIFECDIQTTGSDSLILLGISNSSLIAGYGKWKPIGFFLKNTNKDPSEEHLSREHPSNYIHFAKVDTKYSDGFVKGFPQLTGMEIFAVYLKALTVKQEDFLRFEKLGDGDLRNMLPRQVEHIKKRRILLIAINLPIEKSAQYQKQVEHIPIGSALK